MSMSKVNGQPSARLFGLWVSLGSVVDFVGWVIVYEVAFGTGWMAITYIIRLGHTVNFVLALFRQLKDQN